MLYSFILYPSEYLMNYLAEVKQKIKISKESACLNMVLIYCILPVLSLVVFLICLIIFYHISPCALPSTNELQAEPQALLLPACCF